MEKLSYLRKGSRRTFTSDTKDHPGTETQVTISRSCTTTCYHVTKGPYLGHEMTAQSSTWQLNKLYLDESSGKS